MAVEPGIKDLAALRSPSGLPATIATTDASAFVTLVGVLRMNPPARSGDDLTLWQAIRQAVLLWSRSNRVVGGIVYFIVIVLGFAAGALIEEDFR